MDTLQEILGTQNVDFSPKDGVLLKKHKSLAELAGKEYDDEESITNYNEEVKQFEQLHENISSSDDQLKQLQDHLREFHNELNDISSDMEQLQDRSLQLTGKIEIRQQAEEQLRQVVDQIVLSPSVINTILNKEISREWRNALENVKSRRQQITYEGDARRSLELLIIKATERIRDFVVANIKEMRKADCDATKIQNLLTEYSDLFEFLHSENEPLADGLRQAYINTARWFYSNRFNKYIKAIETLLPSSQDSTLVGDDFSTQGKRLFGGRNTQNDTQSLGSDSLSIGMRRHIIEEDSPVLKPTSPNQQKLTYSEQAYRSVNLVLLDNACEEYKFLRQFFKFAPESEVKTIFQHVFGATIQQAHAFTRTAIIADNNNNSNVDTYAVLLSIRIIQSIERAAQSRRVPILEDYCNLEIITLWPKFQQVMDAQCGSVRRAASRSAALSQATSAPSLPHAVTQQVSTFMYGLLSLCNENSAGEPLDASIRRLSSEFESFLTKVSAAIKTDLDRERFLKHNYALLNTVIGGFDDQDDNPVAKQFLEHYEKLINAFSG